MLAPTIGAALLFLCLFNKHHKKAYCQQSAGKPDRADGKNVCQQRAKPGAEREQADHAEICQRFDFILAWPPGPAVEGVS